MSYPKSKISKVFSGDIDLPVDNGVVFVERSYDQFKYVLDFLRFKEDPPSLDPKTPSGLLNMKELQHWGLFDLK